MSLSKIYCMKTVMILCLLVISKESFSTDTLGNFQLKMNFSVGYKTIYCTDNARPFFSEPNTGRPLRLMVWYPAKSVKGQKTMNFGDYFSQGPSDTTYNRYFRLLNNNEISTLNRQYFAPDSLKLVEDLKQKSTYSIANAATRNGRYPVILYCLGLNDYQQENTILCEYLASQGYIVITVPQIGRSFDKPRLTLTREDLELQKSDFEFVLHHIRQYIKSADIANVIAVGHSFGGLTAFSLSLNEANNIKAVVSLDGANTVANGIKLLKEASANPYLAKCPQLNFYKTKPPVFNLSFTDSLINAKRLNIGIPKATHFDFQNWPVYLKLAGMEDKRAGGLRTTDEAIEIYFSACLIIKEFISKALNKKLDNSVLNMPAITVAKDYQVNYNKNQNDY